MINTLLLLPSFHLNKSLTRLKNTFRETAYQHSFERKNLTMTWVLFILDNPDQIFVLLQNLLWCIHSFSCPHSIWTNPWLDWKTLFVKLHTDTLLNAKFDNDMSTFFVDNPDQKFLLLQNLLGCIHFYSCPHSIWTSPWLDWKTLFVKLHTDTPLSAKLDIDMSTF